jgi:hypothetical protein
MAAFRHMPEYDCCFLAIRFLLSCAANVDMSSLLVVSGPLLFHSSG